MTTFNHFFFQGRSRKNRFLPRSSLKYVFLLCLSSFRNCNEFFLYILFFYWRVFSDITGCSEIILRRRPFSTFIFSINYDPPSSYFLLFLWNALLRRGLFLVHTSLQEFNKKIVLIILVSIYEFYPPYYSTFLINLPHL